MSRRAPSLATSDDKGVQWVALATEATAGLAKISSELASDRVKLLESLGETHSLRKQTSRLTMENQALAVELISVNHRLQRTLHEQQLDVFARSIDGRRIGQSARLHRCRRARANPSHSGHCPPRSEQASRRLRRIARLRRLGRACRGSPKITIAPAQRWPAPTPAIIPVPAAAEKVGAEKSAPRVFTSSSLCSSSSATGSSEGPALLLGSLPLAPSADALAPGGASSGRNEAATAVNLLTASAAAAVLATLRVFFLHQLRALATKLNQDHSDLQTVRNFANQVAASTGNAGASTAMAAATAGANVCAGSLSMPALPRASASVSTASLASSSLPATAAPASSAAPLPGDEGPVVVASQRLEGAAAHLQERWRTEAAATKQQLLLDLRNVESDIKRLTAPQEKLLQRHIHLLAVRQTATEPEKSTPVERGVEAAAAELCAASSTSKVDTRGTNYFPLFPGPCTMDSACQVDLNAPTLEAVPSDSAYQKATSQAPLQYVGGDDSSANARQFQDGQPTAKDASASPPLETAATSHTAASAARMTDLEGLDRQTSASPGNLSDRATPGTHPVAVETELCEPTSEGGEGVTKNLSAPEQHAPRTITPGTEGHSAINATLPQSTANGRPAVHGDQRSIIYEAFHYLATPEGCLTPPLSGPCRVTGRLWDARNRDLQLVMTAHHPTLLFPAFLHLSSAQAALLTLERSPAAALRLVGTNPQLLRDGYFRDTESFGHAPPGRDAVTRTSCALDHHDFSSPTKHPTRPNRPIRRSVSLSVASQLPQEPPERLRAIPEPAAVSQGVAQWHRDLAGSIAKRLRLDPKLPFPVLLLNGRSYFFLGVESRLKRRQTINNSMRQPSQ
eukprot:GHVT01077823.1.p1 GENE.GHVT01077823.1~~GHVT01077823.1.p1  ORF type:complete len:853 (+),score=157.82 GHVT01077823.1:2176-4734(+)